MSAIALAATAFKGRDGILLVWDLPWPAVREFEIRGAPREAVRGKHAHRTCDQIIRCSAGSFFLSTQTDDKSVRNWPMATGVAVLVPRMNWIELFEFSTDAVVTVLCSESYSPPIADFAEFILEVSNNPVQ